LKDLKAYHYKKISDDSRVRLYPIYERVLNQCQNRQALEAPFTKQAALKLRSASQGRERDRRDRPRRSSRASNLDTLL